MRFHGKGGEWPSLSVRRLLHPGSLVPRCASVPRIQTENDPWLQDLDFTGSVNDQICERIGRRLLPRLVRTFDARLGVAWRLSFA
jgi:hypothetical protein